MSTAAMTPGHCEEHDLEFFQHELASFLPDKIFDAHTHSWRRQDSSTFASYAERCGWQEYQDYARDLHPLRQLGACFLPSIADPESVDAANQWNAKTVADGTSTCGAYMIRPQDDPERAREEAKRLGFTGFKCYRLYATTSAMDPEASIPSYLPEQFVKVAHEQGWFITLHVFKRRAMADPENLYWVQRYCEKYPNMKLILAHSARGFNPSHNLEGLPQLQHLHNLFFDTSANCEPMAHQAILRMFGHKRLLYGTDLPISHVRGRSFAVADFFRFVYSHTPIWDQEYDASGTRPVLLGLEHLRSLKWACWSERLTDSQVEDVFWNNACELFNVQ